MAIYDILHELAEAEDVILYCLESCTSQLL